MESGGKNKESILFLLNFHEIILLYSVLSTSGVEKEGAPPATSAKGSSSKKSSFFKTLTKAYPRQGHVGLDVGKAHWTRAHNRFRPRLSTTPSRGFPSTRGYDLMATSKGFDG